MKHNSIKGNVKGSIERKGILEYGHAYLPPPLEVPDESSLECINYAKESLIEKVSEVYNTVIIDDTLTQEKAEKYEDEIEEYLNQLSNLGLESEIIAFESEFEPILDEILEKIPKVDSGDLGDPEAWGYLEENGKLYSPCKEGEGKTKTTLKDESSSSKKVTDYTCQFYDTGIIATKLGDYSVPDFPSGEIAITIHDGFMWSSPHQKSQEIQKVLSENGIIEPKNHYEFDLSLHGMGNLKEELEV